jgi:cellulose synthase/poly-beta-1,6-N-acetylglucosamine synthase-like glycosyltransferase
MLRGLVMCNGHGQRTCSARFAPMQMFDCANGIVCLAASVLAVRRLVFCAVAALGRQVPCAPRIADDQLPGMLILIPCHNEEQSIGPLLRALSESDYPGRKVEVVCIDDACHDRTAAIVREFADVNQHFLSVQVETVSVNQPVGKTAGLRRVLEEWRGNHAQVVFVVDADHRPARSALRAAVAALFSHGKVAAVGVRNVIVGASRSPIARFVALEQAMHQDVTVYAKSVLGLAPPLRGVFCARLNVMRKHLAESKLADDADLTIRLHIAGWRTMYEPSAVTTHQVPDRASDYVGQRVRWNRGFHEVLSRHLLPVMRTRALSLLQKCEILITASGYMDRLIIVLGISTMVASVSIGRGLLLATTSVSIIAMALLIHALTGMVVSGQFRTLAGGVAWYPFLFALDVSAAVRALFLTLCGAPKRWDRAPRDELDRVLCDSRSVAPNRGSGVSQQ